ncbi:MAG: hypothetical protein ACOY4R_01410 [Pseudomonadota bacterium]
MTLAEHALAIARIETGQGTPELRARVVATLRLEGVLSTLTSKTSALLRFNSIVVAAFAYLLVVAGSDPFATAAPVIKTAGKIVGHLSLLASVVSCGFAFPVIGADWRFFGGRLDRPADVEAAFDEAALRVLADLVVRRSWLYAWSWRLAVTGGTGFAILVALATLH